MTTTTETTETTETTNVVTTLGELVNVILSEKNTLQLSNQRNADIFNQLQEFITEKTTGVTQIDGAISALSSFVTDETPEDDQHVVRLTELRTERKSVVEQIQNADTQRRNIFNSITMTEGALQILNQVLSRTDVTTSVLDSTTVEDETE